MSSSMTWGQGLNDKKAYQMTDSRKGWISVICSTVSPAKVFCLCTGKASKSGAQHLPRVHLLSVRQYTTNIWSCLLLLFFWHTNKFGNIWQRRWWWFSWWGIFQISAATCSAIGRPWLLYTHWPLSYNICYFKSWWWWKFATWDHSSNAQWWQWWSWLWLNALTSDLRSMKYENYGYDGRYDGYNGGFDDDGEDDKHEWLLMSHQYA